MDEATVRNVMAYYFKLEKVEVKATPQEGSGPDFLQAGHAIEVKGSDADFMPAIRQFIDYLLTGNFQRLSVAFPHDVLAASWKLAAFGAFCEAASGAGQSVPTYLLTEDKNFYYVRRFNHGRDIWIAVFEEIRNQYLKKRNERSHDWQVELPRKALEEFKNFEVFEQTLRKNLDRIARGPANTLMFLRTALPHENGRGAIRKGFFESTSVTPP